LCIFPQSFDPELDHMNNADQDVYYTKDLHEASALICAGAKIVRLQPDTSFVWFVLENKSLCERLSNDYWAGTLQLPAKSYADSLRNLKDRLFARR